MRSAGRRLPAFRRVSAIDQVSDSLTLLNDRVIWLLDDTPLTRRLIGRYIDVWGYPDGRLEIRADGVALPCVPYDKLAEIDQGAVVQHKRLGHALQIAQAVEAQRDNRPASGTPSRTNRGAAVRKPKSLSDTRKPREATLDDWNAAVTGTHRNLAGSVLKTSRRDQKDSES
ncbi:hypothetical protein PPGU19_062200 (plasmid) [Paraburkholderia sp. PGU19]|nr:hypothetical protein PPGU19_062200 [Paraburkholderia sp. PGU19]